MSLDAVEQIVEPLVNSKSILVGGQAIFFWLNYLAQQSRNVAALVAIPSQDVDYLGGRRDAELLANALHGRVTIPPPDDHGPSTARVDAIIEGQTVEIDFLHHVLGIDDTALRRRALIVQMRPGGPTINVMHPIHCLMSRGANATTLRRSTPHSRSQLAASAAISEAWIVLQLKTDRREAKRSLRELYEWLRGDSNARDLHRLTRVDILEILRRLKDAPQWDDRYRAKTISQMIAEVERRRKRR